MNVVYLDVIWMNERDMLKYSCRKIKNTFRRSGAEVDTHYRTFNNGGRVKDMEIDVEISFTIPQKNIALLDDKVAEISEAVRELTGGDNVY